MLWHATEYNVMLTCFQISVEHIRTCPQGGVAYILSTSYTLS